MHGTRGILMPTIVRVIRQSLNCGEAFATFDGAQQFAESNLAFATDNVIDAAAVFHVGFGREAGIVTTHDNANTGLQRVHQFDDSERSFALKGHDGEANYVGLVFAHQPLHCFTHLVLNQNEVGNSHFVMRVDVPRQGTQRSIGHPHRDRRHVLERVGHGKEENIHDTAPANAAVAATWNIRLAYMLHRNWHQLAGRMV
jgi:hypothetical protein